MRELRREYLFDFANLCHISPPEVDALRLVDFAELILHIDAARRQMEQHNNGTS